MSIVSEKLDFTSLYSKKQLNVAVFLLFLLKIATTTVSRCIYPFADFFAADMGIPVGRLFLVLSFGELIGAICPLMGPYAERVGPRRMILWSSLGCVVTMALLGPGLSVFPLFVIAWCAYNITKTLSFGAIGAFIGLFIPQTLRTRSTGVIEFSWFCASFGGMPLVGYIISVAPFQWVMYIMSIFTILVLVGLYVMFVSPTCGCARSNNRPKDPSKSTRSLQDVNNSPSIHGSSPVKTSPEPLRSSPPVVISIKGSPPSHVPQISLGGFDTDDDALGSGHAAVYSFLSVAAKTSPASSSGSPSLTLPGVAVPPAELKQLHSNGSLGSEQHRSAAPAGTSKTVAASKRVVFQVDDSHVAAPAAYAGGAAARTEDHGATDAITQSAAHSSSPYLSSDKAKSNFEKMAHIGASKRFARSRPPAPPLLAQFGVVFRDRDAVSLLIATVSAITCASVAFSNYAPWVTEVHNLTASELGSVSVAIGIGEMVGELAVILVGDRFNAAMCASVCFVACVGFSLALLAVKNASITANMSILSCFFMFVEAEFVFLLAAGTMVAKTAQTTMYLSIFSALQVARFIGGIVVHPMWVNGGIVTTALSLAGMQAATLVFAVALWRRTASVKHASLSDVRLVTPRAFATVEGETEPVDKPVEAHEHQKEHTGVIAV